MRKLCVCIAVFLIFSSFASKGYNTIVLVVIKVPDGCLNQKDLKLLSNSQAIWSHQRNTTVLYGLIIEHNQYIPIQSKLTEDFLKISYGNRKQEAQNYSDFCKAAKK